MASEASPPRYRRLEDDRNANVIPHRGHGSLSISPPPFHRPRSDRDFQGTSLEAHFRSDSYRPSSHSYKSNTDSYRPGNNRKQTSDTYRPLENLDQSAQWDAAPRTFRSLSTSNSADLHDERSRTLPPLPNQLQTNGTAHDPSLVGNMDFDNPPKSSAHPGEDLFDFSKVPKGPALMAQKGPPMTIPRGPALKVPTGPAPKISPGPLWKKVVSRVKQPRDRHTFS
jgi:hypothetical protein